MIMVAAHAVEKQIVHGIFNNIKPEYEGAARG